MTYWAYHLIFTLPLIAILTYLFRRKIRRAHIVCWLITCLIVLVFTTPWDNYAVFLGIWGFGDGVSLGYPYSDLARQPGNPVGWTWIGFIPVEEYVFFLIEATLACLAVLGFLPDPGSDPETTSP